MKIAAGDDIALTIPGNKHQRIIHRRIHLNFECPPAEFQRVPHRAMHLGNTAQRVRILYASAVFVGFANLAAGHQSPQIGCDPHLSGMWPGSVNAFIKRDRSSFQSFERHGAGDVSQLRHAFSSI